MKNKIDKQLILDACSSSITMSEAAVKSGLHLNTFRRYAERLGVYKPNPGKMGISKLKREGYGKVPIKEILEGKHPSYQTFKLKKRLLKEGIKKNECEICGINEWCCKQLNCELDHINGVSTDHRRKNLRMICPNCHSQTETFRAKNKRSCQ